MPDCTHHPYGTLNRDVLAQVLAVREDFRLPDPDGPYCAHGTYVGGIGPDWMCQPCEDGVPDHEYANAVLVRQVRTIEKAFMALLWDTISNANGGHFDIEAGLSRLRAECEALVFTGEGLR